MLSEAEILEGTFWDTCTIKRKIKIKDNVTGISKTSEVVIVENVKCALSKNNSQNQVISVDGVGKLNFTHVLFCKSNVDIKEADIVEVKGLDGLNSYVASKPFTYQSHKETNLTYKDRV